MSKFFLINLTIIFSILFVSGHAAKLPSAFQRCKLLDQPCIRDGIEGAIKYLKDGAPELTLKPFEPLDIESLIIGEGKGAVNVQQNFKNIHLHGLTGSKVLDGSTDLDNNILRAKSITPELRLEAEYTLNGKVLLLPIRGAGPCNVTLVNTKINHTLYGESFVKKGKKHLKIVNYHVTLRPEKVIFQFANLFDGDEKLGYELNKVLNDNNDEVFADVRDGYEKSFGLIFQDLANRLFTRVPLKDIFLDYND